MEGLLVGDDVGTEVGKEVLGTADGMKVGFADGVLLGRTDGILVGVLVAAIDMAVLTATITKKSKFIV